MLLLQVVLLNHPDWLPARTVRNLVLDKHSTDWSFLLHCLVLNFLEHQSWPSSSALFHTAMSPHLGMKTQRSPGSPHQDRAEHASITAPSHDLCSFEYQIPVKPPANQTHKRLGYPSAYVPGKTSESRPSGPGGWRLEA